MSCPWSLVSIHWIDAYDSDNGWIEIETYKPAACHVVSIGFLWPECLPGYISITGSYMPDEVPNLKTIGMVTHIPVSMVQNVKVLDQPKISLTLQHPDPML